MKTAIAHRDLLSRLALPGFALLVLAASLAPSSCVRTLPEPEERLASFDVTLDFDAQPNPGVALATCTCPFGGCAETDLCPGDTGSRRSPIPFPGDQWATVRVDIVAVGSKGTRPFPIDTSVALGLRKGELFGPTRQARLTGGEAQDVIVRMRRTPGATRIWVEDNLPRDDGELPTFSAGVSDVALHFGQPRIEDIQQTTDECCNPMQGQRVEIVDGELYVTRTTGNGFNLQDVTSPQWGGIFVFAFNGVEGLRVGTKLIALHGAVTEFQSATQMTEPTYFPVNGLCEPPKGTPEGGQETDLDETAGARSKCPDTAQCVRDEEGVHRCTPDGDPGLDEYGRRVCVPGNAGSCPAGLECRAIEGQGSFCQVAPLTVDPEAFPTVPYCGPIRTAGELQIEAMEGSLIKIEGNSTLGVRLEGLPICQRPSDEDPLNAVRSSCNRADLEQDGAGNWVPRVDCAQAANGEPLLRDEDGNVCFRHNQACRDTGQLYSELRSSCLDTGPPTPRCQLADPGDDVLLDLEEGESIDASSRICRNTLDDFLTGGLRDFGQAKVYFEDEGGDTRCATVNLDALTGIDIFELQEQGVRWKSLTGTLRQVRFAGGSGYWMVDVRYAEDLEPM
jgi:hypothetical protein